MAIGILVAVGNALLAAGPFIGGFLVEIVSWRWIFWINVPIVLATGLVILAAWERPPRDGERPAADVGGLVMLVAGLGMLVVAVMQGASWGWTRPVILALLAGGAVVLILFVRIERRRTAPLIAVGLFRDPAFTACNGVVFVGQFSKMALVVFGAIYLQHILKMSPLTAGLALLAAVLGSPILAVPAGRVADRYGTRWPALAGLTLLMLTTAWIGLAMAWDSYALLLPGFVLWGIALPFCYTGPLRSIMDNVPPDMQGQASGISMTTRLLGSTIGIAICSTLYATTESYRAVFLATAAFMLAALVYAFFTMDDRDRA
jgi:MFS family permease